MLASVTPHKLTLAPVTPNSPEWLQARRSGIGASEIAAVLGISPFESPFSLWWRKHTGTDLEVTPEMEWGHRLEPAVVGKFADNHPDLYVADGGLAIGPEPWMLATPDRLVGGACAHGGYMAGYGCSDCLNTGIAEPPTDVLEAKTGFSDEHWGEPGTAEIPVYYRAQVQWQMLCTGLDRAHVAVLIGGSDYREYLVRRDRRDIAVMVELARRFRHTLQGGDMPPLDDHHATLRSVRQMHPDTDGTTAVVSDRVARAYLRSVRWWRLAKKSRGRWEAELRMAMGRASRAVTRDMAFVASRSVFDVDERVQTVRSHIVDRMNAPRRIDPSGRQTPR